jgi:hypothetical protein
VDCGGTVRIFSLRRISRAGSAIAWALVQIDGSEHAPFEDCDPPCTLLGFVDDWFPADDPRRTRGHLSGTAEVASAAAPMLPQGIANRGKAAKASLRACAALGRCGSGAAPWRSP